jgi:asparagine synthase (glutamine-hydrolysing)
MCGIFGVINFDGQPADKGKVLSARDILAHRGPDDAGIYFSSHGEANLSRRSEAKTEGEAGSINPSNPANSAGRHTSIQLVPAKPVLTGEDGPCIALAHRRLSIIDLSPAAHQPMVSDDGRFVIVFNGEIYNYEALKAEVGNRQSAVGNNFKSNSDTEVILKLFAAEGAECLNKLRGMFAFAIWDDKEKKLFAARDRFGIKPFYYLHNDKEFIFSSELKAIKHYKNGLTLSMEGMDAFLRTGSVPAPLTIYDEARALLPGHWLEIKSNSKSKLEINQYWNFTDLLNYAENLRGLQSDDGTLTSKVAHLKNDSDATKIIRNSLLDSIRAHMVADVEVGAFLSGGIDSTSIVSLMRQAGHDKIKTISVTFPGFVHDEAEYSNIAAQVFATDHFEYRLQEREIIDGLDKIIEVMDQPTIDGINTYFVSKAAKAFGLKVVLSGLGGDELFGGYPSFIKIPKYRKIKSLPLARQLMKAASVLAKNQLPAKAIEYFKNPDAPNAEYKLIRGLFTDAELSTLGWKHTTIHPFNHSIAGEYDCMNVWMNDLVMVSFLESCVYMRNQLLRDSDVFSMANSIELRVPFVDHLLYEAVLPYLHSSFDKNETKKMLVAAVGDLPKAISERMKMGFTFPFDVWMRSGKLNEMLKDTLLDSSSLSFINVEGRRKLLSKFEQNKIHWSRLWAVFIASRFGL